MTARFTAALPFALTAAQSRVAAEVAADLARERPMHRLLQGDVGSGKTVVAALAMYLAAASGFQAALMAPTELLAEQHATTLARWFAPLGIAIVLLTGTMTAVSRREALASLARGEARIAVGTHVLFQEAVSFDRLALIVVDEQHRFGVEQRLALKEKGGRGGRMPHQLTMTATPIPRTLAMTAYAGLDCSVIDELPAGREPVQTIALPRSKRPSLVERVAEHCKSGAQAYWVCPLIEESEQIDAQAAEALHAELCAALPEMRIGLVHGRLRGDARDALMRSFKDGDVDLLVATTVVEVGVDVPNASLMIVEGAERMGLAQLHQLRGRVGRGERRSTCVLLYEPGLSALLNEAELVLAPQLLAAEVANTYWKYFRAGQLAPAAAETGLRSCLDLVDEFVPLEPLSAEALELAMAAKHPVYDMFYLVLARRQAAVLLTADKTLADHARRFRARLSGAGFDLLPGETPIIPVMLGEAELAQKMARALDERGVYVAGFFYPVVPDGQGAHPHPDVGGARQEAARPRRGGVRPGGQGARGDPVTASFQSHDSGLRWGAWGELSGSPQFEARERAPEASQRRARRSNAHPSKRATL